jgi:YYY domain-containing protein
LQHVFHIKGRQGKASLTQTGRTPIARIGEWLERHPYILPFVILVLGGGFRFYNLNWDSGNQLHPDERWIYTVLSGANGNPPISWPTNWTQFFKTAPCNNVPNCGSSPLDPHFFAYGSLPFYLLAMLAGAMGFLGQHIGFLSGWAQFDTYGGLPPIGRALSGCLDLAAVFLVFLVGRRVFGYWAGVVAMALTAFTVLDIQLSHFYAVDTVLTPLALATLLAAVHMAQTGNRRAYVWGGIAFGAALATKTTALLLIVPLGSAAVLGAWTAVPWSRNGRFLDDVRRHYVSVARTLNDNLQWLLGAYVIAAVVFVVCEPYAVLDRNQLLSDIAEQTRILVTNDTGYGVPYMVQYVHTIPYLYQLQNMVFWEMGLPLGIAACAGVIFYLIRNTWRFRPEQAVLLLWIVPYFLFVGRFFAKFNRYMLPITPVMTILAGALLVTVAKQLRGRIRPLAWAPLVVVVLVSFLYSLAYMNIYAHPNTRVAATKWIYSAIPAGATIAVETPWDDTLPLPAGALSATRYHTINLDMYADELSQSGVNAKVKNISAALTRAQYIILSSERMIRSIPRLPSFYPVATRYYDLLQSDKLNFRQVLQFQQHPQLGPIVVHDYPADESFHVYDHPDVRIYKRVSAITSSQVAALLTTPPAAGTKAPAIAGVPAASRAQPADTRLMLTPSQWRQDQRSPSFGQMFPPAGFAMRHPIIIWLLFLEVLGLLAFPIAFLVFRNLPDRGFVIGKTFGILLLGYAVWISVSLGAATYDRGVTVVMALLLAAISALLYARFGHAIVAFVRAEWRRVVLGEAIFLAGFVLFVLLRAWFPDLAHQNSPVSASNLGVGRMGEKQMELAFLNAIVRSRVFPPYDPFFAHGYINYYYYGFFLVGTICKLLQISPMIGFNLAIATFFALLVGNVSSVVLALTRRVTPAILAAAFVGVFGNLNGGWQLIRGLMGVATTHSAVPFYGGLLNVLSGLQQVVFGGRTLPPFDYWESTRIIPPVGGPITEFPYFTYLFADLHPHLIAFPMTAAALALAVNFVGPRARGWQFGLWIVVSGIVLGAIAVTNPWDFPTYGLVLAVGALAGVYLVQRRTGIRPLGPIVLWMAAVAAISTICYLPFKLSYETVFTTGIGFTRSITPDLLGSQMSPSDMRDALITPLRFYLEHFGFFLFAIMSYLVLVVSTSTLARERVRRASDWLRFVLYYRDRPGKLWRSTRVVRSMTTRRPTMIDPAILAGWCVLEGGLLLLNYYLLAFLLLVASLVVFAIVRDINRLPPVHLFVLALLLVPIALSAGTQVVFVKDFLAGGSDFRMNTIFKFYNQVWLLFAVGAACALHFFVEQDSPSDPQKHHHPHGGYRRNEVKQSEPAVVAHEPRALQASFDRFRAGLPFMQRQPSLAFSPAEGVGKLVSLPGDADQGDVIDSAPASRDSLQSTGPSSPRSGLRNNSVVSLVERRPLWSGCLALLAIGCLIYTYAGAVSRETARSNWLPESSLPFTLDGMAFMKVAYPEDFRAISWLNANVTGAPVIAEADGSPQYVGTYYDWRSRVSQFTGLPDILSGIHEGEQRWSDEIDPTSRCSNVVNPDSCLRTIHSRIYDLNALYDSPKPAEAWRVIKTYGVRYIYVGFSERQCTSVQCYSHAGLEKFNRMVGHGVRIAFRTGNTTIYQVTRA